MFSYKRRWVIVVKRRNAAEASDAGKRYCIFQSAPRRAWQRRCNHSCSPSPDSTTSLNGRRSGGGSPFANRQLIQNEDAGGFNARFAPELETTIYLNRLRCCQDPGPPFCKIIRRRGTSAELMLRRAYGPLPLQDFVGNPALTETLIGRLHERCKTFATTMRVCSRRPAEPQEPLGPGSLCHGRTHQRRRTASGRYCPVTCCAMPDRAHPVKQTRARSSYLIRG